MNIDVDELVPNYRRASERWPDAPTLSQYYQAIVACCAVNGHGLVEEVKSFIECVCVTILGEFGEPMPSASPSTTELLVAALQPLGLRNSKGASKLDKVLSAFNKLADALSEMRNENGPVAHGKDGFLDGLTADHTRVFLHTGDAILSVLLNALDGKEPNLLSTREPYERFQHLNDKIDRSVAVKAAVDQEGDKPMLVFTVTTGRKEEEALELRVEPSRLLFGIDREAFIEALNNAPSEGFETEEQEEEAPLADTAKKEKTVSPVTEGKPPDETVAKYEGRLSVLRPALEGFLRGEDINQPEGQPDAPKLVDSLLATADQNMGLDWRTREALQARMKVGCRRVLVRFGCEAQKAEKTAERLVAWLRIQVPDRAEASAGA